MSAMIDIGEAVRKAGGTATVSRALGVTQQVVCNWIKRNQIPAGHVIGFERITGESRHDLRSDVFGESPKPAKAA